MRKPMKPGNKVIVNEIWSGTILFREAPEGFLKNRFCVKFDDCPANLRDIQRTYGGLFIFKNELTLEGVV